MVHCDIAVILGPRGQTEKGGLFWVPLLEGGHRYILLKAQTGIKQAAPKTSHEPSGTSKFG